jgi:hypothetical protein
MGRWSAGGDIALPEAAAVLPYAWPTNAHYKSTPLHTQIGFLHYFHAWVFRFCALVRSRDTWEVLEGTLGAHSVPLLGLSSSPNKPMRCGGLIGAYTHA